MLYTLQDVAFPKLAVHRLVDHPGGGISDAAQPRASNAASHAQRKQYHQHIAERIRSVGRERGAPQESFEAVRANGVVNAVLAQSGVLWLKVLPYG